MRHLITGPDGTRHVLTDEEILALALKQLFPSKPDLPPMVEMDEMQPPQPPPEAAPPAPPPPNPMEQIVPLIMDAVERLVSSIDAMGAELGTELSAGLKAQGERIAAQHAQSIAALAEELGAEQEVVRDDDGRVKGSRRKSKELN